MSAAPSILVLLLAACDDDFVRVPPGSFDPGDVSLDLGPLPTQPVAGALALDGTAEHSDGYAIVDVVVNGVSATPTSAGYATFTVELPLADLQAERTDDGTAEVCARARGATSGWSDPTCAEVPVEAPADPQPTTP